MLAPAAPGTSGTAKDNADTDDLDTDDLDSDEYDSEEQDEKEDRKKRQLRHKQTKLSFREAVKTSIVIEVRSEIGVDLITEDYKYVDQHVTKILETAWMNKKDVGIGGAGMNNGHIWFKVTNTTTKELFEKQIPKIAAYTRVLERDDEGNPTQTLKYQFRVGEREDAHKIYTCYLSEDMWAPRNVLERRIRMLNSHINVPVTEDGVSRLAVVKVISGGQDKVAEIGDRKGFIAKIEIEARLIPIIVYQCEKGMEGRLKFSAMTSCELQGNGIEAMVKAKLDADEQKAKERRERRERIKAKRLRRKQAARAQNAA